MRCAASHWELLVGVLAVVAAVVAFWVTLNAHFLRYPAWLGVQKADFILGPIGVGLYWRHRRPDIRLGPLLVALGLCAIPYVLTSLNAPALFGFGVFWEFPIALLTEAAILAFPSGRLDGLIERMILTVVVLTVGTTYVVLALTAPQWSPAFSLSGCRSACPANALAIWSPRSWTPQLVLATRAALASVALATIGLLIWRFVTGTPPRRRALAIGVPIALIFLLAQATFQIWQLFTPK